MMIDAQLAPAETGQAFRALIALIGSQTSDGRIFDALTWREPPLTVYSQMVNAEGHDEAPIVGRIDRVERNANEVWGYGVLDTGSDAGRETIRMIREKFLRGVSVDAAVLDMTESGDGVRHFSAEVGALTIVGFPAFRETEIELVETPMVGEAVAAAIEELAMMDHPFMPGPDGKCTVCGMTKKQHEAAVEAVEFAASGSTSLPIAARDRTWDGPGAAQRVKAWADAQDGPNAKYGQAFFVVDGPADQFGSYHLGFADVIGGTLTAVPRGIFACAGAVMGSRGASNPAFQQAKPRIAAYYKRMASQFDDPSMMPPWMSAAEGLDMGGVTVLASARPQGPPRAWFANPDLDRRRGLHVEADGRIWGHVYGWGECHIGSAPGTCVQLHADALGFDMISDIDGRGVLCADGTFVRTGPLVIAADHADLSMSWHRAKDHYANTALAVGDVVIGADAYGIWCAGAVRPGTSEEMLHALRASQPSVDCRDIAGRLEVISLLAVNMPGYPARHVAAGIVRGVRFGEGRVLSLVASGGMVEECGCGETSAVLSDALERLASLERDLGHVRAIERQARANTLAEIEVELGLDRASMVAALEAECLL